MPRGARREETHPDLTGFPHECWSGARKTETPQSEDPHSPGDMEETEPKDAAPRPASIMKICMYTSAQKR